MHTATTEYTAISSDDDEMLSADDIAAIERGLAEPGIVISADQLAAFLDLIGGEQGWAAWNALQPLTD